MLHRFNNKHILLLQGPLGPFFKRFSRDLEDNGATVTKVNFCGGDRLFFGGKNTIEYRDTLSNWLPYLKHLVVDQGIDAIIFIGDCRPYHKRAIQLAHDIEIDIYCFEEGYLRPSFITLEKHGVNGNSRMPKDPSFFIDANYRPKTDIVPVGKTFGPSAWWAVFYYTATSLLHWRYPNYVHHRPNPLLRHGFAWVRGLFRKIKYKFAERNTMDTLAGHWDQTYFLFPLQVHNDFQFCHSQYKTIEDCIDDVVGSFARHAPKSTHLVIKHHPADRPYRDYTSLIKEIADTYGVRNRILYVHDLHLPSLLRHAKGTVLMNSTVGLTSIHYNTPVMVLGESIYKLNGLTHTGSLETFWNEPETVDRKLYTAFRGWLEHHNQYNGNYYKKLSGVTTHTGVRWS